MPKPLMIIKGSLYERAEVSCNKSLGSNRKWENNVKKGEEKRKKKDQLMLQRCNIVPL